jgi:TolB protein
MVAVAMAALVAFATTVAARPAAPQPAAKKNGDIFFCHQHRFDEQVYSMSSKGNHQHRLTEFNRQQACDPAVSPSGGRVAFTRWTDGPAHGLRSEVWIMDADGKHQRRLTERHGDSFGPAFSPDGDEIAFEHGSAIWVMRSDGSHAHQLVKAAGAPAYSPDGETLVFERFQVNGGTMLWTLNLSSGHTRPLGVHGFEPSYSPDGDTLVYDILAEDEVWRVRSNGKHARRIATGFDPAFSPDGDLIVFTGIGPKVMVMRANGSRKHKLAEGSSAAWAPR